MNDDTACLDITPRTDSILVPSGDIDPELNPSYKEVFDGNCFICWAVEGNKIQKVKWIHGLVLCKPCCVNMEAIERE